LPKKQKVTEKPLPPPREEVTGFFLPSIQFRKRKCPEFARTATHWKNFTSSFKGHKKGAEEPLSPHPVRILLPALKSKKALKNLCRPRAKRLLASPCIAFNLETLSTLSSVAPLRTGRISLPALKSKRH
jgi:hypothetical protein